MIIVVLIVLIHHNLIETIDWYLTEIMKMGEGYLLQLFNMQMSLAKSDIIANLLPMDGSRLHPQFNRLLPDGSRRGGLLAPDADAPPLAPRPLYIHRKRLLPLQHSI